MKFKAEKILTINLMFSKYWEKTMALTAHFSLRTACTWCSAQTVPRAVGEGGLLAWETGDPRRPSRDL